MYRRPSGVYAVRLAVPLRLRCILGKRELHVSTGTRTLALAKTVAAGVLAHWRMKFMDLERLHQMDLERLAVGTPALLSGGFLSLSEAGAVSGIGEEGLLRIAREGRLTLYFRATGLEGYFVPYKDLDLEAGESEIYDVPPLHLMPPSALFRGAPPILEIRHPKVIASSLLDHQEINVVLFTVPGRKDVAFAPGSTRINRKQIEVSTEEVESARLQLAAKITPDQIELAKSKSKTEANKNKKGNHLLSTAISAYMAERAKRCKEDQARRIKGALNLFLEMMGDRRLIDIDRDLLKSFRDEKLPLVPADENKVRLTKNTKTVAESIRAIEGTDWPRISISEQQKRIKWLEDLFQWLADEQWLNTNIASGLETGGAYDKQNNRKRAQDARATFTDEELRRLFGFQWFRTGKGEITNRGTYREFQPRNYWLPLLGLYTGARIRELCQIKLTDIRQHESGIWYLDINDTGTDGRSDHTKSLKNLASIRRVPLHPHLLILGIIEWRDRLQSEGFDRFFPELSHDDIKGYGKGSTKWFGSFLANRFGWERNGTKTFHSFRHTLITKCMNEHGLPPHRLAQITGHSRGSSVLTNTYTKDLEPDQLMKTVEKLDFGITGIVAKFDIEAGIKALHDAINRQHKEK